MKIVLATPLYPPDTGAVAAYSKEVARRLSERHNVTVVAYGRLFEGVPAVKTIEVSKQRPLIVRLLTYTVSLIRAARNADIIYAQNGASVEFPAVIAALMTRTPYVLHIADIVADNRAAKSLTLHIVQRIAFSHAREIVRDTPEPKPEILPFESEPTAAITAYEASWKEHISLLESTLHHE